MANYDSLLIGGHIECIGPGGAGGTTPSMGTPSTDPNFPGVVFSLQPGYSLGEAQPTVDLLAPLLFDGERPWGRRASNRTIQLPIYVIAPVDAGDPTGNWSYLAAAVESLMYTCDADTFQIIWTRHQGGDPQPLPLVFDCFRAAPATVVWGGVDESLHSAVASVTLNITALPYGRADVATIVDFQSPLAGVQAPPSPVQLDNFLAPPDLWNASAAAPSGSGGSAYWDAFNDSGYYLAFTGDGVTTPSVSFQTQASQAATAAGTYRAYFWVLCDHTWAPGATVTIQWFGVSGFISQSSSPVAALTAFTPAFIDTGLVTAPAGTTFAKLAVQANGVPATSSHFLIAGGPYGLNLGTILSDPPVTVAPGGTASGNFLTLAASGSTANSGFEGSLGTWNNAALVNCTVTDSAAQAHSGADSMLMTSAAAGNMAAAHTNTPLTQNMPCVPGQVISAQAWFWAAASPRACNVGVDWYNSSGTKIGTTFGPNVTDSTTAWTEATDGGLCVAIAGSASCRATVRVQSTAAVNELHYADDVLLAGVPQITLLSPLEPTPAGMTPTPGYWQIVFHGDGITAQPSVIAGAGTVAPLRQYTIDFWALSPQGWASGMAATVDWYNGGTFLSTSTLPAVALAPGVPVEITGSVTAPATANNAIFNPGPAGTPPAATLFYLAGGGLTGSGNTALPGSLTSAATLGGFIRVGDTVIPYQVPWQNAPHFGSGVDLFPPGSQYAGPGYIGVCADLNLVGQQALTIWAGFGSSNYFPNWCRKGGLATFQFVLIDAQGNQLSFSRVQKCYGSNSAWAPRWNKVRVPLPKSSSFNFADVVGFQVYVSNHGYDLRYTRVYLSDLEAVPPPLPTGSQPNFGQVYDLGHVAGSARAPVSVQVQFVGSTTQTRTFAIAGAGQWTCPVGVTSVNVYAVGGGGGGGYGASVAAGGGGGGGSSTVAAVGVTPGNVYNYVAGAPGGGAGGIRPNQYNGGNGAPSSFAGDSVTVTAPGGGGAPGNASTAGGAAGSAGTGGHAGGTGGTGLTGTGGGGGGSSGGSAAAGNTGAGGATGTGGAAVTGGGQGGHGANSALGNATAGSQPGGGGGGGGGFQIGSPGSAGYVQITYSGPGAMESLIAHRPGFYAPAELTPFVPIPISDTPNGTTQYPIPQYVPGVNARFGSPYTGTYSVVVAPWSWSGGATSGTPRTVTVTVTQYEQTGGANYTASASASITPSALPQLANPHAGTGFARLGEVTLPPNLLPSDNIDCYFTVSITSGNTADRFQDVLFLDTMGSTVIVESPVPYQQIFIDEPDINASLGNVLGTVYDRADAVSVMDRATISGGPLDVDPYGNRALLVYSMEGNPMVEVTYFPRYWLERSLQ